jgi:hypothetical protein
MVLDKDKITRNTKKYFDTATKKGFMTEELTAFLGTDFMTAPASTRKEFNNSFEGGLIDHLLQVTKYAVSFNSALPETEQVDVDSLIKVCFLHQIGKSKLFKKQTSQWHLDKGINYDFNNNLISMRVSERSIYYATSNGVSFTEEETAAILNFDKTDDKQSELHNTTLGDLLKMASTFAIKHEQLT